MCPQPPDRHAQIVQILGVVAEPRPGIVGEDLLVLPEEVRPQRRFRRPRRAAVAEDAQDLRPRISVLRPRAADGDLGLCCLAPLGQMP